MLRQLLTPGYFSIIVNDAYTYTNWAWQFYEALKEGIIYPRWLPLNFWGYGSPIFILYPPFAYYLTAFFNLFVDSIISAMNITKFTALFFSTTGLFFLAKEFYSEKIALFTALFYLIFPYTVFQFYLIGTFASMVSFMWFPPILLFAYRYIVKDQVKYILYAGLCFAGLVLTHLINAYMFTFVIVLFIIYFAVARKKPNALIAIPVIFLTGFLVSSAYILPLIFEKQFLSLKSFVGEGGGFHYAIFFILPDFSDKIPADNFWHVYHQTFVFYLFLFLTLFLICIFCLVRISQSVVKSIKEICLFFTIATIFSLFFLFGISTFLWETIPFFKYIQFPSRWFNITNFTASFLSSIIFWSLITQYRKKPIFRISIFLLFFVLIFLDLKYINYAHIFHQHELMPVKVQNSNLEHLPVWAVKENISGSSNHEIEIMSGTGKVEITGWKSAKRTIKIDAGEPLLAKIRTFNFPGWKAYLNGAEIEIQTDRDSGAMLIEVARGRHTLELRFVDTPIRYYSKLITLLSLLIMIFILIAINFRNKITHPKVHLAKFL